MTVDLGWVDIGLLLFMALSIVVGLVRGVVFEILSLAGWVVAYIAAQLLTPLVQPHTSIGQPGSALNHAVAFACVFLVSLVLWGLGARLVRLLIRATPLSSLDRLLGAAFGLVRGLLVLLLLQQSVVDELVDRCLRDDTHDAAHAFRLRSARRAFHADGG